MAAYLIGEDGPHRGAVISFEEGDSWILGRDPDLCFFILEDPMVSRKHALIRLSEGSYFLENQSATNPLLVNGTPITESCLLQEDDSIQIGNSFFRFTEIKPDSLPEKTKETSSFSKEETLSKLPFIMQRSAKWMLKVVAGPNQGAEYDLHLGESCTIGKDASVCDLIFQDQSVSRQHAKLEAHENGELIIQDLDSKNGTFVSGVKIAHPTQVHSQDIISLGTTSFLMIDREASQETIYSKIPTYQRDEEPNEKQIPEPLELVTKEETEKTAAKKLQDLFIPTNHLVLASIFCFVLFASVVSFFALFRSHTVVVAHKDETKEIKETIKQFENVQFSYNPSSGKIFLIGHVLTDVEHSELIYLIKTLPFITSVEDNVVDDEGVWENMNALLVKNPNWRGVMVTASKPGRFVLKGYLQSEEESIALQEYVNLYFPYLNLLDNQVVVENTLQTQLQSMLTEEGFVNVSFQFANGELIFAGRVNQKEEKEFEHLLMHAKEIRGIRQVKNFVIYTSESTARIDLSSRYNVMGTSKHGDVSQYVLINGKILSKGEVLDGMLITAITSNEIQLDRDGIKYKIDYNQQ